MLLLSHRNTQLLPDMTACINTTALLKPRLLSLREHLGCIMQIFPHHDVDMWGRVWMSRFRGTWQSLNFYKEYLFGFETLVFATSGILSMHNQLVTLQEKGKLEIASYDPFKLWQASYIWNCTHICSRKMMFAMQIWLPRKKGTIWERNKTKN